MNTSTKYISATEARNNFFALLERVRKNPFPVNITVKGIPEAVIMNKEDYDAWVATVETLSDPQLMAAIKKGDEDIRAGRFQTLEEIEKEFKREGLLGADKGRKEYVSSNVAAGSKKGFKKT